MNRRYWIVIFWILLLLTFTSGINKHAHAASSPASDGELVVFVTWGDLKNTPANDVYIEAHGFVRKFDAYKSFVLESSMAGVYKASLPPGVYDVFISEGTSKPRCKRLLILPGKTTAWKLKLDIDLVYTQK